MIAVLLSATLLASGCGGGDDGFERAVEWHVVRPVGPKSVRLVSTFEGCSKPVQLEPPFIEHDGDRIYLELRHTPEDEQGICFFSVETLHKTVTFDRDLDELVLFDASTDPPERRWPRRP